MTLVMSKWSLIRKRQSQMTWQERVQGSSQRCWRKCILKAIKSTIQIKVPLRWVYLLSQSLCVSFDCLVRAYHCVILYQLCFLSNDVQEHVGKKRIALQALPENYSMAVDEGLKENWNILMASLEVQRGRRVERSRGEEGSREESRGEWFPSTLFGYFKN